MLGSTTGRSLLQACWDDNAGCGTQKGRRAALLHSPLLAELQALESRVREDTAAAMQSALVQERFRCKQPSRKAWSSTGWIRRKVSMLVAHSMGKAAVVS